MPNAGPTDHHGDERPVHLRDGRPSRRPSTDSLPRGFGRDAVRRSESVQGTISGRVRGTQIEGSIDGVGCLYAFAEPEVKAAAAAGCFDNGRPANDAANPGGGLSAWRARSWEVLSGLCGRPPGAARRRHRHADRILTKSRLIGQPAASTLTSAIRNQ